MKSGLVMAAIFAGAVAQAGVTRSVEPVEGGSRITLAWDFAGAIESDLVIEERYSAGWSVDDSTVPFASLDASWFSGSVARLAVKPALLSEPGSISFTVTGAGASGTAAGDWRLYLEGKLEKGRLAVTAISALATAQGEETPAPAASASTAGSEPVSVAISSFRLVGAGIELEYRDLTQAGTLVVEGCSGFGREWVAVKRTAVSAGDGKVTLSTQEGGDCRFFRMQLYAEE